MEMSEITHGTFITKRDTVHWTPTTSRPIFNNWCQELNLWHHPRQIWYKQRIWPWTPPISWTFRPSSAHLHPIDKTLWFIPHPTHFDWEELQRDLNNFHRKIRLLPPPPSPKYPHQIHSTIPLGAWSNHVTSFSQKSHSNHWTGPQMQQISLRHPGPEGQ